jgi:hypothetical protein
MSDTKADATILALVSTASGIICLFASMMPKQWFNSFTRANGTKLGGAGPSRLRIFFALVGIGGLYMAWVARGLHK